VADDAQLSENVEVVRRSNIARQRGRDGIEVTARATFVFTL
jgi:hypothetical protein